MSTAPLLRAAGLVKRFRTADERNLLMAPDTAYDVG